MKNILEPSHKRQITILEFFLLNEGSISLDELSNLTNVSVSTVLRDINYFQDNFSDYINIKKNNLKSITIVNLSSRNIKFIQHTILNKSLNINILKCILLLPFNNIEFYANLLEVSSSSVYKNIKEINKVLMNYQIEIKSVNNSYFVIGKSEIIIRKLFSIFWVEINLSNNIEYQDEVIHILESNQITNITSNKFISSYYYSFIYISLLREKNKFYLENHSTNQEDIIEHVEDSLNYSPFTENNFFYNRSFYQLIDFFRLHLFKTNNNNDFSEFYGLIKKIYVNEISHQIPVTIFISQLSLFNNRLKEKAYIYKRILSIISKIESILKIDLTAYISLLSYVLIVYYPNVVKNYSGTSQTIYIYSTLSTKHADFLKFQLENYFDCDYSFEVIEHENIPYLTDTAILITNDIKLQKTGLKLINDYLNNNELKEIDKFLLSEIK